MNGSRPKFPNGCVMCLCAISLMAVKSILRVLRCQLYHVPVSGHFRQNGRCRNVRTQAVTMDHRAAWHSDARVPIPINQRQFRFDRQFFNGAIHGQISGAQNIQFLDLLYLGKGDTPLVLFC